MLWITGAKGLLGSALCKAALHSGVVSGREVDISDVACVRKWVGDNPGITHIVNCAAFSRVDDAEVERESAYRANVIGPQNLALAAQEMGAKLIHISTDYVFAGNIHAPQSETDPTGPCNYYGETKLEGEELVLSLGGCVIRTSWIFGLRGNNFVSKLLNMLQVEKEIRLTDDQWGRFTYAPDLAKAILQMLDQKGLYQYANGGVSTKYEFAVAMREEALLLGFPVVTEKVIPVAGSTFPAKCKRPIYSAFNTTKIETILPIRHWKEAMRDYLCAQSIACL